MFSLRGRFGGFSIKIFELTKRLQPIWCQKFMCTKAHPRKIISGASPQGRSQGAPKRMLFLSVCFHFALQIAWGDLRDLWLKKVRSEVPSEPIRLKFSSLTPLSMQFLLNRNFQPNLGTCFVPRTSNSYEGIGLRFFENGNLGEGNLQSFVKF